ncbi:uncharacterized protein LOC103720065 isoform X1 [Phoenix dactylifera]|uniref:Uncharacterized protein LOC103720065 isoform X1 n=1 Tax=Phoenix dactylifera TaxID=42345 RepID=A0A8B9A8R6_PHODC|nr:uncharacterized protein LOC103720065 isoform X1 [Phoenix dactylifera]XP_008807818.2 uncharacterized protein LOC103720065 isoform X1 [Phoenix dactylifera]XP_008807820.2 uncharacterized protein LOC103720065 isoform X1 [Phoenix dactylifera]XP_026665399.2 uncharacterized protein LOC103720065 isoform X1 [Phoenix dactylifera]XP_038982107.1 uncharacterized protein LOC103720065 isoform X1 [Phoenix dactylifera]XP_038982108.1 uncharacterized protein LOC103720065 isoform X1 [Phoenix dactylifera]
MMSQHPGLSHCFSRQQQGFNDMQLWQQNLIYKQIQEIQRQQQLQQLDEGGRPQNLHTQLSEVARQAAVNQFPGVLNGMPISEASNYMLSNGHEEGELKTLSSSHMLLAGSMNMAPCSGSPMHGLMFSHDQSQLMRPLGFAPQLDQSLNGTPVSHCRDSLIYSSQFQGMSHDCTDAMTPAGGNQAEKPSMPSSALSCFQSDHFMVPEQGCLQDSFLVDKQGFQGKVSFAVAPVEGLNSGATSGNYQQADNFSCSLQAQDFHSRQEDNDWSGTLQEKAVMKVEPSHIGASIDQTEEKLLFGAEDDGNWAASFGSSITNSTGFLHGNPLESNDHFHAFPSIQNGSWCALMQEALEASSSDTGLHEEWSGLSFQKTELSSGNKSAVLSDNGKQQMMWDDNNLQSASSMTSRLFPFFNDADASSNCHTTPGFEHPIKFAYELNESVSADASHESIQQPSKEARNEHLDQSHQKKQFAGANFQMQTHLDNVSNGVWEGQMYEQSVNSAQPAGMELNLQNTQVLAHQQKMPLHNVNGQHGNNPDGWNVNGSLTPDILIVHDNDATNQHAQRYETNRILHMDKNCDNSTVSFPNFSDGLQPVRSDMSSPRMNSDDACMGDYAAITTSSTLKFNQEINQQVVNRHRVYYGKHVAVDSSAKYVGDENFAKYQNELSSAQHAWDSSLNTTDQGSAEMYNHKQKNSFPREVNEGYVFSQSHPTQHTDPGGGARADLLLAGNEHHPLVASAQYSSGQSGQKTLGPCRFQYHPMGNLEMNMETDSQIWRSCSQGSSHLVVQGSKNQEQAGHAIGSNAVHIGKGRLIDMQRSAKGVEEIQYKGSIPGHGSAMFPFDVSAARFSQNRSDGQASQNMLNLLHKVDQSRERNTVVHFSDSKHTAPPEIPESAASDGSSHLQHSQSYAFGLKLAPPSQRQPLSSHSLPSQTSLPALNDCDSKSLNSGAGDKDQMFLTSPTKILSIPSLETSQRENLDNKLSISGQANKSSVYEKSLAPSSLPYARNRDISSANELAKMGQSTSSFESESYMDGHSKHTTHPNLTDDSSGGALADQSAQASLPSLDGRVSSFRLALSADTCAPIASQVCSLDSGHPQLINADMHAMNSGQQPSLMETKSVDQHSATAGFSQQGGFSTMLHNIWTSVSSQQCLSGAEPKNALPIINQSTSPLPSMRVANSCTTQITVDDSNRKGESASFIDTYGGEYSIKTDSSEQKPPDKVDVAAKKGSASRGQEPVPKHISDGNSSVSIPSLVRLYQQDLSRVKYEQDSNFASLNHDKGASGQTLKLLDAHAQNYSLLQQAMKDTESDPSKRVGKRLKGADLGCNALQMEWAGQRFIFGQKPVLNELDASFQHSSFPSDVKMLSFSSKKDKSTSTCSQVACRDLPSQDLLASGQHDIQNHANSPSKSSKSTSVGGNERPWISPQMAPSWFGQYGTYKNGQILAMYDGLGNSQRTAKGVTCFSAKVSESMHNGTVVEQRTNVSQVGSLQQNTSLTARAAGKGSPSHHLPPDAIDNNMTLIPKKRKSATSELLPWHKEVMQGSKRLQTSSMAELDWAQALNRLIEKVEDEFEIVEDGPSITRLRRRLVLTTQLMQQLIPSVPAMFLNAEETASYGSLTYFVAKLALGDVCSLISCAGNDSHMLLNNRKMRPEELKTAEKAGNSFFSKTMENFIGRLGKLETNLLRLEKRSSILDLRVECRDLERCSILNRFAMFHGRARTDGVESLSTSENAPRRALHQSHVTAFATAGNFPEGVLCFSL